MTTTLEGRIETIPPDLSGPGPDHRYDTITVTADTYPEALAQARSQVPDGWRLINVRTI